MLSLVPFPYAEVHDIKRQLAGSDPHPLSLDSNGKEMPIQKSTKLNTGAIMPLIGLGTWKAKSNSLSTPLRSFSGMATGTSVRLPGMVTKRGLD
ncbi:hypothetical protein B0F90DRAFT_212179 [Multifurca ochricompacta]|uniref:Uncharacterized protein n=1 Tax=Multifurca ochricompacta TaxID=376703 RepID=A0AAD4M5A5_9AGAM|nr:hypothetical protein B0F90DRAFT_212179 [Multifurca ochricompacta]